MLAESLAWAASAPNLAGATRSRDIVKNLKKPFEIIDFAIAQKAFDAVKSR